MMAGGTAASNAVAPAPIVAAPIAVAHGSMRREPAHIADAGDEVTSLLR